MPRSHHQDAHAGCIAGGDHACLVFESERERREQLAGFVRDGLAARHKVVCLVDADELDPPAIAHAAAGVDVAAALASGQFEVRTTAESYLAGGRFDPGQMAGVLTAEAASARAAGWAALRITGEMTWSLGGAPGCDRLFEYERAAGDVLAATGSMAICQYDARRFTRASLRRAELTHPLVLRPHGARAAQPPRLRVQHDGAGGVIVAGEVDFANVARLAGALGAAVAAGGRVTLDAHRLAFVDAAGVRALCGAGAALGARGERLVVVGACPIVARAIALVAGSGLAGADRIALVGSGPPV